ncbi:MAG: hypothetical protein RL757_79 [Bacteroidota bacterium]|jgi:hypothetical protein
MFKNLKQVAFVAAMSMVSVASQAQVLTPQPSPMAKSTQTVGLTDVSLEYSRPSAKGRKVFGELVPMGEVWRTGANASTKITFADSVEIGGQKLKKGTYAVYVIPQKDAWTVIFNNDLTLWGSDGYDEKKDALRVSAKTMMSKDKVETFTISTDNVTINGCDLTFAWDDVRVSVAIAVPTDQKVMGSIKTTMDGPSASAYFNAGRYYFESGKDLKQAIAWMDKGMEMGGEKFWMLRQKSLAQEKAGDLKAAIATAKKSLELAKKEKNMDYVRMNEKSIEEWSKKVK